MARGTTFGKLHSDRDLHLIQRKCEVQPAAPRLNLVDIPGADGSRDLSEQPAGRVTYKDRKISWTFSTYPGADLATAWHRVNRELNGKEFSIILDDDPGYYYRGRVAVKSHKREKQTGAITVEATCRPFALRHDLTRHFVSFSGKNILDTAAISTQLGGGGVTWTRTTTGLRATWKSGTASYAVLALLPLDMVEGLTVTLSASISRGGNGEPYLRLGYSNADGSNRVAKANLTATGSVTLTVKRESPDHEWLALWVYAKNGGTGGTTSDYVNYNNLQLELGSMATTYAAYAANPGPFTGTLSNESAPAVPTLICTGETSLTIGGVTATVSPGAHRVFDFVLPDGSTGYSISGTGAAAIVYQEGTL